MSQTQGAASALDLRIPILVMTALTLAASFVNYASQLVFARLLTPGSYGDLTALLALVVVIAFPTAAAQTIVADRLAVFRAKNDLDSVQYLIRHALAHVALYAVVLGTLYFFLTPLVTQVLDLTAIGPAIALAPLLMLSFFLPVTYGVLQGLDKFVALGIVVFGVAVSRIAFGVPWTLAGGGAGGPLAGQALGSLVALGVMLFLTRNLMLGRGTGAATSGIKRRIDRRSLAAGGAFIAFALLSNLDVILAKIFLDPFDAGLYAALVTVGKIVLFVPAAVSVVMVPFAARQREATGSSVATLRVSALAVAIGAALIAIPASVAPTTVMTVMFGDQYAQAAGGVLPIVLAGALLALLYLLVVYTVAIQDHGWTNLLLAGVVLDVIAISIFHETAIQIATVQAVVMIVILVVNELLFHPILRAERLLRANSKASADDSRGE